MFLVEIGISIVLSCILGNFIINKISTLQSYKKMHDGPRLLPKNISRSPEGQKPKS